MSPSRAKYLSSSRAEQLGNVLANAADQFLISYLILTRFPESSPYALGFVLAHCLEVSIKAAYYQTKGEPPPTGKKGHLVEYLIERLPDNSKLKAELESNLPDKSVRKKFDKEVDEMNKAPPGEMLQKFFKINPKFDSDEWMLLYAMFRVIDLKYGVDVNQHVLQLMQPVNPTLNKSALRLIAKAREYFPDRADHRKIIADFVGKLPKKYGIAAEVKRLVETGAAQDTPDYITGNAPPPLLMFDSAELDFIKLTFELGGNAP